MTRSLYLLAILSIFTLSGCNGDKKPVSNAQTTGTTGATGTTGTTGTSEPGLEKLIKEDVKIGTGNGFIPVQTAADGDLALVTYTGKFKDGITFDTNDKPDANPLPFFLGRKQVIEGWDEGVKGMKVGGVRKLSVPWSKGYGDRGSDTIPAKSDLYFEVKLLDLVKPSDVEIVDTVDVKKGTGPAVAAGDKILVKYEMKLVNGRVLDSQKEKPIELDVETVNISGFKFGLKGMKKGGVRKIRIPPLVGYSSEEVSNQVLYVEVQLLDVMKGKGTKPDTGPVG